jgi:hypothetical protein
MCEVEGEKEQGAFSLSPAEFVQLSLSLFLGIYPFPPSLPPSVPTTRLGLNLPCASCIVRSNLYVRR